MFHGNTDRTANAAKIFTAVGLICFVIMLASVFHWRLPSFGKAETPPPPDPDLEITATAGSLDEIAVIRYYSHEKYPDAPPVEKGNEIEYGGDVYVLRYVTDGLVSTQAGDCWEAEYRIRKEK